MGLRLSSGVAVAHIVLYCFHCFLTVFPKMTFFFFAFFVFFFVEIKASVKPADAAARLRLIPFFCLVVRVTVDA
ncbi:hypothetical protein TRSC58_07350 [Trypanosoma rangeli SC58]|uniref:Uncharacterized protein n=1 Tax=Trypanosoma rangeli SC58 TaxID=429131 RepID=A0A061IS27_TRYRA|nr:hypothetical protein TRSC58_07350 [Trypanosoma rangeli SC58]